MPNRSWWIDEPDVLASSNPSNEDLARHRADGFSVLISLLDETRQAPRYDKQAAAFAGWTLRSLPIEEGSAPSLDQLSEFDTLLANLPERTKTLIHCESGLGRSAFMGAVYWFVKGCPAAEAVARVERAASEAGLESTWLTPQRKALLDDYAQHHAREKFRSECVYYGNKCHQWLYRTRLSCDLALVRLGELLETGGVVRYEPLVSQALNAWDQRPPRLQQKLFEVLVESHFLTLKANFEYFLNRLLYCLWWWQFEKLVHRGGKLLAEKVSLRDLAKAVTGQGAKEFVIGKVIPTHGLELMAKCYSETTGITLHDRLNAIDPKIWSQIHSAFEVRHLIEHRKGKIDQRFRDEVASQSLWRNSSWDDFEVHQATPGTKVARIEVRRKDFEATFEAMVRAAENITALTKECWQR